jgi:transcriptional regulator with XRE-family HTH domain
VRIKSETPNEHPLLRWRREHRITLAGMAERTGSTPASISRIENDKQTPSYQLIRRLGVITGLGPEIFLERLP